MVHHKHKFIFIHIPKTGGTSVEHAFDNQPLDQNLHNTTSPRDKHATLEMVLEDDRVKDYFKFTFIRNPWDRIYSHYRFFVYRKLDTKGSFKNFVQYFSNYQENKDWERLDFLPQLDYISSQSKVNVDFIGHFDSLQQDFNTVCEKLNIPYKNLLHTNHVKKDKKYQNYYDEESKEIIAERYRKDIEYFNYIFD